MRRTGMIAVCLLTADRLELTRRTLESFRAHHGAGKEFLLLHADDASQDLEDVLELTRSFGFLNVYQAPERRGQIPALLAMWGHAHALGANRILHLENDQEFVAPIPVAMTSPQYSTRLYGEFKGRAGPRARTGDLILGTDRPIAWETLNDRWDYAPEAHWGGQPSITWAETLLRGISRPEVRTMKDLSKALILATVRPRENITWHIGEETTPNRVPGLY